MKALFMVFCLMVMSSVNAMELNAYANTSKGTVTLSDAEVDKVFSSGFSSPACLKDGSRIIGVNKAYTSKRLGYRDCSQSDAAKIKQAGLGYEVIVVKLEQLSPAKMKQAMGIK